GGPLVICHGDFHPLNILVDKGAVTGVIDWANITLADPAYDVGATTAIFSHGPVDIAAFAAPLVDAIRNWIIRRYRRRYEELQDLDNAAAGYFEALRSLGFLVEAGQRIQAERGIVTPTDKPTAFADPRQLRRIRERIEELTGVPAALPN
ncbi:MAG: aminoglycoside phosphotransferase family protein, partial [Dehalococcoidia bacterium]